jgi:PilZ domain
MRGSNVSLIGSGGDVSVTVEECRTSARQRGVANRARIEWWEGDAWRETAGHLVNLSAGGALMVAEDRPPVRHVVWCCLEEPGPTDWLKATVVRHGPGREVGLAFADSCPLDFTLAATLGLDFSGLLLGEGDGPSSWL